MPIILGQNIASLKTQRQLTQSSEALGNVMQRLASGQRINKASDDAAGLSIASSLNSDARVYGQAIRNINDGLSMLSIANGNFDELSGIVTRIRELAEQSANGANSGTQRKALDAEAQELRKEFNRIVQTTKFNGKGILNGGAGNLTLQVGLDANISSQISIATTYAVSRTVGAGFTNGVTYNTPGTGVLSDIVTTDVNNDGKLDLLTHHAGGNGLAVVLGNGDGTFQSPVYTAGNTGGALVVGDINGDGKQDYIRRIFSGVRFGRGNGDGTFTESAIDGSTTSGDEGYIIDLNHDGKLDFVITDTTSNIAKSYFGNGDGTFQAAQTTTLTGNATDSFVTDINDDGNADLIYTTTTGGALGVAFGTASGTFSSASVVATGSNQNYFGVGDINNDGALDIAGITSGGAGAAVILIGNGDGTFKAQATVYATNTSFADIYIQDLNEDGFGDLVSGQGGNLVVALSNGDGTFQAPSSVPGGTSSGFIAFGDFNRDGATDAALGGSINDSSVVYLQTPQSNYELAAFNIRTASNARQTLDFMATIQNEISFNRSTLGAFESRLTGALRNAQTARENYLAAAGRIMDADVAVESAELIRNQILQQAQASVLAQANQLPSLALLLLGS